MYVPEAFSEEDSAAIQALVTAYPLATLITVVDDALEANPLPMLYVPGEDHGTLIGHLSKANPQWKTYVPGTDALAIFHGPDVYVSPNWYPSKHEHGRVVPTWNYAAVHMRGPLTIHHERDWLLDIVTRLTDRHESGHQQPWRVTDAPQEFIEGLLRAIVGIEMQVTRIEAKSKASQNRGATDRAAVAEALDRAGTTEAAEMAKLVRK